MQFAGAVSIYECSFYVTYHYLLPRGDEAEDMWEMVVGRQCGPPVVVERAASRSPMTELAGEKARL